MRRLAFVLIPALCWFCVFGPNYALAQSADEVLKQVTRNRPQPDTLKTVYDLYLPQGDPNAASGEITIRETVYFRSPDRIRLNLSWPDREEVFLAAGIRTLVLVGDQAARTPWPQPFLLYRLLIESDPDEMQRLLSAFGFDLKTVTTATYHRQPVVIIGADAKESARSQVWFDRNEHRLVRLILAHPGETRVTDMILDGYRTYDHGIQWPGTIQVQTDDQPASELTLRQLTVNPKIDQEDLDLETLSRTVAAPPESETESSDDPELEHIRKQMKWLENKLK